MSAAWFFAENNQQQGPISEDELLQKFAKKQLPLETTLVWTQGLPNWTPAAQVEALVQLLNYAAIAEETAKISADARGAEPVAEPAPETVATATEPVEKIATEPATGNGSHSSAETAAAVETHAPADEAPNAVHVPEPASETTSEPIVAAEAEQTKAEMEPSSGSKWGDLDAIPTPKATSSGSESLSELDATATPKDLAAALDAIPTPKAASDPGVNPEQSGRMQKPLLAPRDPNETTGSQPRPTLLNKRSAEERKASSAARDSAIVQRSSRQDPLVQPHPIKRWAARAIDMFIFAIPGAMVYIIVGGIPALLTKTPDPTLATVFRLVGSIAAIILMMGLESFLLSSWGATVGKRVMGIVVLDGRNGQPLTLVRAAERTLWLYIYVGYILWFISAVGPIPSMLYLVITLVAHVFQFNKLTNGGITSYDERVGIRYEHHK